MVQFTKFLGGIGVTGFSYAGLAAMAGDTNQAVAALGVGSAGLASALLVLILEQMNLADDIKRAIPDKIN